MPTLQALIGRSASHLDVVSPIKARGRDALNAVLKNRQHHAGPRIRLMPRGAERC
ncbi:hypothetical protein MSAS_35840 [Mycobacterium saskatchewanense]|uniref:hypothetical protein n=1 Tax=Mycobacterium saskatchewanense TaxID=220927 RepID=UPI00138B795E|nr:hypothetical protein [Mycobacterium saskatchewanense]BBX64410.1 hypothetical protein MSAS_35840 [Mycobacterium saskatchewanense]